jgi:hypothetical protein
MNTASYTFVSSLIAVLVASTVAVFSQDSFSFSGRVRVNVGCLEIVPPPIRNATVTVYDNQSCIIDLINAMSNEAPSYSYSGRLTSFRTTTDSAGHYRFGNLDADSFVCFPINQIVEVEAEGYYPQRRDIVPERDSLLYFNLLATSKDSSIPVTITVVAVDTSDHYAPIPLKNYRIEIPNRYLPWITPQAKDTTDENGKAAFTLSVVPYVDYRIVAKSLNGDNYRGESIADIASCMGNNVTIPVHIPRTMIQQDRIREKGPYAIERIHNRLNSGLTINVRISEGEYGHESIRITMFDVKGKSVGCFKKRAGLNAADRGGLFTVTSGDLPAGMYVLKMKIGKKSYSEKIAFGGR